MIINIVVQILISVVVSVILLLFFIGMFLFPYYSNIDKNHSVLGTRKYGEKFHKENNEE